MTRSALKNGISADSVNYVFVGAFADVAADGSVGGQSYACTTLLNSPLSSRVRWTLIDSSFETKEPGIVHRALRGAWRLAIFAGKIVRRDISGALIFSGPRLSFLEKGLMALVAKARGKRVVFCPRSGLLLQDIQTSRFMRWFVPFVLRRCDVVVCQGASWQLRWRVITGLPVSRLAIIPNWIDLRGTPSRRSKSDGTTSFLYLGRIESYKGIFDLIEAVHERRKQLAGAFFIVCGGGTKEEDARRRVVELGLEELFEFRGWIHGLDKHKVLSSSDVLVLPSHFEGMPNSLLEGMSYGMASVASDVGGIPDVIVDHSVGIRVPPQDTKALGEALVTLHRDQTMSAAMGASARRHVLKNHDVAKLWKRFLEALVPSEATRGLPRVSG